MVPGGTGQGTLGSKRRPCGRRSSARSVRAGSPGWMDSTRRGKLLSGLGTAGHALRGRLRAPVGLPLGGRSPESIALAIVAELHAHLHRPAATVDAAAATPAVAVSRAG